MTGEMEILFSLAGRVHVLMRREINRIIDVEWMCADATYAKEVVRLARTIKSEELGKLIERIEEVHPLLPKKEKARPVEQPKVEPEEAPASKYMKTLR